MKIEQMEYLVYFAQTGSVAATASHFYMTKQGMNKALHQLEHDSGYMLFESEFGGLKLTKAGEEFAARAQAIIDDLHDLRRGMRIFANRDTDLPGSAVIVLATSAAMRYLVPPLGLQNPGVFPFEVFMRESGQREMVETLALRRSEKVMGLITVPVRERYIAEMNEAIEADDLIFDTLGESDVYALVSTSSKLSQLSTFDIERDLVGQKVGYLADEMLRDALDDYVRDEDVRTVMSNIDLLDEQIATNRLITFAPSPRLISHRPPSGIAAIPCANGVRIRYGIVRARENQSDPDILQVITRIRASLSSESVI